MMKVFVTLALLTFAAVSAQPKPDAPLPFRSHFSVPIPPPASFAVNPHVIRLLSRDEVHDASGQFALRYQTENGIIVEEEGHLVPTHDKTEHVLVKSGSYSYPGTDGKIYTVKYTSDLDGFHAEGEHLPIAPSSLPANQP